MVLVEAALAAALVVLSHIVIVQVRPNRQSVKQIPGSVRGGDDQRIVWWQNDTNLCLDQFALLTVFFMHNGFYLALPHEGSWETPQSS